MKPEPEQRSSRNPTGQLASQSPRAPSRREREASSHCGAARDRAHAPGSAPTGYPGFDGAVAIDARPSRTFLISLRNFGERGELRRVRGSDPEVNATLVLSAPRSSLGEGRTDNHGSPGSQQWVALTSGSRRRRDPRHTVPRPATAHLRGSSRLPRSPRRGNHDSGRHTWKNDHVQPISPAPGGTHVSRETAPHARVPRSPGLRGTLV